MCSCAQLIKEPRGCHSRTPRREDPCDRNEHKLMLLMLNSSAPHKMLQGQSTFASRLTTTQPWQLSGGAGHRAKQGSHVYCPRRFGPCFPSTFEAREFLNVHFVYHHVLILPTIIHQPLVVIFLQLFMTLLCRSLLRGWTLTHKHWLVLQQLQWCSDQSRMFNRTPFVNGNKSFYMQTKVKYGAPQGSVLGSILFTLYVLSFSHIIYYHDVIFY